MKESLAKTMKEAVAVFRRGAKASSEKKETETAGWLSDNFYILERRASLAADECGRARKIFKGSDLLPSLFLRCENMCAGGVMPDEEGMIEFLKRDGLDGISAGFLPLAVSCALVDLAAKGVASRSKGGSKRLANAIASLRGMSEIDFERVFKELCASEPFLREDPTGIYPSMDEKTKSEYRRAVAARARKKGVSEADAAREILEKAKKSGEHIGKYVFPERKNSKRGRLYLAMEIVTPLAGAVAAALFFRDPSIGLLLFFPLWETLRYPIESVSMKGVSPKRFPRLDPDGERAAGVRSLITVSTIMPSADKIGDMERKLERLYLGNGAKNIGVCCLADFKGAATPRRPEDKPALKALKEAVDRLNKKYGGGFTAAVRARTYSAAQEEFIGAERKRGAIAELVRAVKGKSKGFALLCGDVKKLTEVKYIIALDADSRLVFDSARELAAIAGHPLNRPVIKNGRVVSGYGILVPKTENRLNGENSSPFARVMAGETGVASYDSLSAERYQDLFGEAVFSGKGLIDADAFYEVLDSSLPEETVLSHDILEGGYLRAGFVPDVQITEEFPQSAGAYFQRLDRWVRGDWQNVRFIFGKNPLNALSRYKLFDNLRRSLTPFFCISSLFASMIIQGDAGLLVAAVSLVAVSARNLFGAFNALMSGGFSALSRLYFSKTLPSALNAFVRAFVTTAFSARESLVCFSAAVKALWRLFISGKNLLEWTPAALNEKNDGAARLLRSCVPSAVASAALLTFGLPLHRLAGLIILADVPITLFGGKKTKRKTIRISERQRGIVQSYAGAAWGFFDELCGKEDNFLPPDNLQVSPVGSVARRTSPTNIGLMLASFLAARDLGFISSAELSMRMNLSLKAIEGLEKYKGNLYNWYDVSAAEPLGEKFVSTVDSGNFLCCLTAVKEGLREYLSESPALAGVIERIEKLIDETDLRPLYNEKRNLFYIGIEPESGVKSSGYYDLYMSEARMTAYFAVARRIVPKKHWGELGRILVGRGRYVGLASWTGTMFEYFMPNIFIPAPFGSLSAEALHFCLWRQRKRAGTKPFGFSESGFFAFDGDLNYQYKAHGVQKLGLRRGLDAETVVSPYSSFLTLTFAPAVSIANLERLSALGASGKYGFYEALDYTPGRNGGDFSIVRSYMAHHVGMSLLCADNLLNGDCMQKRFMRDGFMRGAESLLEEKLKTGERIFKDVRIGEAPAVRERTQGKNVVVEDPSPFSPKAVALSNGRLSVCISDSGDGATLFDGLDVTARGTDPVSRPRGIFGVFVTDKEKIPFVRAVDSGSGAKFSSEFLKEKTIHTAKKGALTLKMKTEVYARLNCEKRTFIIENASHRNTTSGKLVVYFEPCLEKRKDYAAHPAFSKLFLTDEWDEENRCLVFSRRQRDAEAVCAAAAGFVENSATERRETSREKVLRTPRGIFSLGDAVDFSGGRGNPDCCCAFSVDVELRAREKAVFNFVLAAEETKELAVDALLTVRAGKEKKRGQNPFFSDSLENALAGKILPAAMYPRLFAAGTPEGEKCNFRKSDLWSYGISGDLPIILLKIKSEEDAAELSPYIRLNKTMRSCGISSDLVVRYKGDDGYSSPLASATRRETFAQDCGLTLGVSGGVHLADQTRRGYSERLALEKSAAYSAEIGENRESEKRKPFRPLKYFVSPRMKYGEKIKNDVKSYNFTEGKISISKTPSKVDIPWTIVLANRSFGTMVSDKALGFTWALNSRENKLTPWYDDVMSDNRGEALIMKYNGALYDVVALGDAEFSPEKAVWRCVAAEIEFIVSVSVASAGMVKKCEVEIGNYSGAARNFDLCYRILPVIGVSREDAGTFFAKITENGATMENSAAETPGFLALQCDRAADYVCFSRQDFLEGKFNASRTEVPADACLAVGKRISLAAGGKLSTVFFLSWGACEEAALKAPSAAKFGKNLPDPPRISTGDKETDIFVNSFLYSQIKQCRFFGRTGFYQCSGAYGFRDQLQDSLAFIDEEPNLTRVHLIRCAAVQFKSGDALHWWHATLEGGRQKIRGVRTRCSDDKLWLPYVCAEYAEKTGDRDIFSIEIPYIDGAELNPSERERYISPVRTEYRESLLFHCLRAVDSSLKFGKNGLPLIGSCDWNDGFGRIGDENAGESCWLAMFQKIVLEKTADICENFGMGDKAAGYRAAAGALAAALEEKAWNGSAYVRAFLKDGSPLGGENFIDLLPQTFAAFCGIGEGGRTRTALRAVRERLTGDGVIRLCSPPFKADDKDEIGYIAAYPEGIRENGGQYTHAAVWLAGAYLKLGKERESLRILRALNPMSNYKSRERAARYGAEPYALAGDVYFGEGITGRAGWTQFTGSAAWYYRYAKETAKKLADKSEYEENPCKADRHYKRESERPDDGEL